MHSRAAAQVTRRLDGGFFKTRWDRLTPKERAYVTALAQQGPGACGVFRIAAPLGEAPQRLSQRRARLISKGIPCRPAQGDVAFGVPLFNKYLMRRLRSAPDQKQ